MNYRIIINIPNEKTPTEVLITEEQLAGIEAELNAKRIIRIGDSYFNTTYIAKIVPDVESNMIDMPKTLIIEERSDSTKTENVGRELNKLREKMRFRKDE